MALKDLFPDGSKILPSTSTRNLVVTGGIESAEQILEHKKDKDRFIPSVDYSDPANFARYGSAEKYYEDSIKRIYSTYPYDGSSKEKLVWKNESNYLDLHIFEKEYPRTTGYIHFSKYGWGNSTATTKKGHGLPASWGSSGDGYGAPVTAAYEYIYIKGGPHADPYENYKLSARAGSASTAFSKANIYDVKKGRISNLSLDGKKGNTVEFWLKKKAFNTALTQREVILDVWTEGKDPEILWPTSPHISDYGRLRIELQGADSGAPAFLATYLSGGHGFINVPLGAGSSSIPSTFTDNKWHHYAFVFQNTGSYSTYKPGTAAVSASLYVDGKKVHSVITGSIVNHVSGNMVATIGSLVNKTARTRNVTKGWGKLSASLDEFRFWKTARSPRDIGRYWNSQVNGGSNTDDANIDLGVYYKFNEGIVNTSSLDGADKIVMDYSGRISNGLWVGYKVGLRDTGSAIIEATASKSEFKDPIVRYQHPKVQSLLGTKKDIGREYDNGNNAAIYYSLPSWIVHEDEDRGEPVLKNLIQVISSYFDTLHLQIESLPRISDLSYKNMSIDGKPLPFAKKLLESVGFVTPEIFADASVLETILARSETKLFDQTLHDIKNVIYQNIYNNLAAINKSKGTEKAIRNLMRCFGVDNDLIKINLYTDNAEITILDNYDNVSLPKKYVDFNDAHWYIKYERDQNDAYGATIFNSRDSTNVDNKSYVPGLHPANNINGHAFAVEANVIFPKTPALQFGTYTPIGKDSCIFGAHRADSDKPDQYTWHSTDTVGFTVSAVRDTLYEDDKNATHKFVVAPVSSVSAVPYLISPSYFDLYENENWTFALQVRPRSWPLTNTVDGTSDDDDDFIFEFRGVNAIGDHIQNQFVVTQSVPRTAGNAFLSADKRFFMGAHRTNFVSGTLMRSNIKAGFLRCWQDYLPGDALRAHAINPNNYGTMNPSENAFLFQKGINDSGSTYVPRSETLIMNWDFDQVTSSNAVGHFKFSDISSGSIQNARKYGSVLGPILGFKYPGKGVGFLTGSSKVTDKTYVFAGKQKIPEVMNTSDMIQIKERDDWTYKRDSRPIRNIISIEKSMYQIVSDHILEMFGTLKEFNNLIGQPVNKYRTKYKLMEKTRSRFFENVKNTPDVDKFIDFYRWLDDSLTKMIANVVPATAFFQPSIKNVVESHVLERNKIRHHNPHLGDREPEITGTIKPSPPTLIDDANIIDTLAPLWKAAKAEFMFSNVAVNNSTITLISTDKTIRQYKAYSGSDPTDATANPPIVGFAVGGSATHSATNFINAVNASNGHAGKIIATQAGSRVTLLQADKGKDGNSVISTGGNFTNSTNPNPPATFTGGEGPFGSHCFWWQQFAERDNNKFGGKHYDSFFRPFDAGVLTARKKIHSASLFDYNRDKDAIIRFKVDRKGRPNDYNLLIHGGLNVDKKKTFGHLRHILQFTGPDTAKAGYINISGSRFRQPAECTSSLLTHQKRRMHFTTVVGTGKKFILPPDGKFDNYNIDIGESRNLSPFTLFETSSGETAYDILWSGATIKPDFGTRIQKDISRDNLFTLEVPMQGPYTEAHVGGMQFRHVPLNISSSKKRSGTSGTDSPSIGGLDNSYNRPELYHLNAEGIMFIGDRFPSHLASGSFGSLQITSVDSDSIHRPRATYTRDHGIKRSINIKNIKTSGAIVGNYKRNYELVQIPGRNVNNRWYLDLVRASGSSAVTLATSESPYVSGTSDFTLPTRLKKEHIIVERFAAPGGPEVSSRGFLDTETETFSIYNALPWRNLTVRHRLNKFLKNHRGSDNYDGIYGKYTGSFHSTNRNKGLNYKLGAYAASVSKDLGGATSLTENYDNDFVSHQIPRSDRQYRWISASLSSSAPGVSAPLGFANSDGLKYNYQNPGAPTLGDIHVSSAFDFVISGNLGIFSYGGYGYFSYINEKATLPDIAPDAVHAGNRLMVDLAGLNSVIHEPISSSANLIGYTSRWHAAGSTNTNFSYRGGLVTHTDYTVNGMVSTEKPNGISTPASRRAKFAAAQNYMLNLHRNGAAGYPSWQQVRKHDRNPLSRMQRKNNILSVVENVKILEEDKHMDISGAFNAFLGTTKTKLRHHVYAPVVSKYKPLKHRYEVFLGKNAIINAEEYSSYGDAPTQNLDIIHTYANNRVMFSNNFINELLEKENLAGSVVEAKNQEKYVYDDLKKLEIGNPVPGVRKLRSMTYKECVFPKGKYSYKKHTRMRPNFRFNWRNNRIDRHSKEERINPYGHKVTASIWPLDARLNFLTGAISRECLWGEPSGSTTTISGSTGPFHKVSSQNIDRGEGMLMAAYNQVHNGDLYSLIPSPQYARRATVKASEGNSYDKVTIGEGLRPRGALFGGDQLFEADISGSRPFYDTYSNFSEDIRLLNKDYSIIPEFRMSEHMDFYVGLNNMKFLTPNYHFLTLTGAAHIYQTNAERQHLLTNYGITQKKANNKTSKVLVNNEERELLDFLSGTTHLGQANFYGKLEQKEGKDKRIHILPEQSADIYLEDYGQATDQNIDEKPSFFKRYCESEELHHSYLQIQEDTTTGKVDLNPRKLRLSCRAIMKFLPYEGFYPVERTMQLATLFSKSYGDSVYYTGADVSGTMGADLDGKGGHPPGVFRTISNPFFGPGLLYNSIKGGVACDYPVLTGTMRREDLVRVGAGNVNPGTDGHVYIANTFFDYRMPFETLVRPENIDSMSIIDMEPHPSCSISITASVDTANKDGRYKLAAHNFLAEVPRFFLNKEKNTFVASSPEHSFLEADKDIIYKMRVGVDASSEFPGSTFTSVNTRSNILMYSRPSAFGPPTANSSPRLNYPFMPSWMNQQVPGSNFVEFEFKPFRVSEGDVQRYTLSEIISHLTATYPVRWHNTGMSNSGIVGPQTSGSLQQNAMKVSASLNLFSRYRIKPAQYSTLYNEAKISGFTEAVGINDLVDVWTIGSKFETPILDFSHHTGTAAVPVSGSGLTNFTTQLPAAVGMWHQKGIEPVGKKGVFIRISDIPKKETFRPIGSVSTTTVANLDETGKPKYGSLADLVGFPKGAHKMGVVNDGGKTVSEAVIAIPYLEDEGGTKQFFTFHHQMIKKCIEYIDAPSDKQAELWEKYSWDNDPSSSDYAGGFSPKHPVTGMGEGGPIKMSTINMIKKMRKYVLPPRYDWLKYYEKGGYSDDKHLEAFGAYESTEEGAFSDRGFQRSSEMLKVPFAMYIFEFEHTFTKDDLTNMWQNLAPTFHTKAKTATATIEHDLLLGHLMTTDAGTNIDENYFNDQMTVNQQFDNQGGDKRVKWLIFKVKQRAETNYFKTVFKEAHEIQNRADFVDIMPTVQFFDENNRPRYSYNWPYDYFSMVEMVKLETEIEFNDVDRSTLKNLGS